MDCRTRGRAAQEILKDRDVREREVLVKRDEKSGYNDNEQATQDELWMLDMDLHENINNQGECEKRGECEEKIINYLPGIGGGALYEVRLVLHHLRRRRNRCGGRRIYGSSCGYFNIRR